MSQDNKPNRMLNATNGLKMSSANHTNSDTTFSKYCSRIVDKINSSGWPYISLILVFYFLTTYYRAESKIIWFDEIFTYYLTRLPDLSSYLTTVKQGIDFNPPMFYEWIHFSRLLIPDEKLAIRMPSIVSVGIACFCLYRFVSIRTNVIGGLIASLFPLVTIAPFYATDARPHGIVFGLASIALLCWQSAIDPSQKHRSIWISGLCLSLAVATLTHAYAIVIFFPIVLAEFIRNITLKKIDWPIWISIAIASTAILMPIWLLHFAKAYLPHTLAPAKIDTLLKSYSTNLDTGLIILISAFFFFIGQTLTVGLKKITEQYNNKNIKFELIACIGFIAIPFIAFVMAKTAGAPLFSRYSLTSIIGFSAILGLAISKNAKTGLILITILLGIIGKDFLNYTNNNMMFEPSSGREMPSESKYIEHYKIMSEITDSSAPIAVYGSWDSHWDFATELFYAPAELRNRLTILFPYNSDFIATLYKKLINCCNAPGLYADPAEYVKLNKSFYVVVYNINDLYEITHLLQYKADVTLQKFSDKSALFYVKSQ